MPNSPILAAETVDWTYEDVAEELEHLAMLEELEPPEAPVPELPSLLLDDEIFRAAEELRTIAELEAR